MPPSAPLPPGLAAQAAMQGGPFTTGQARDAGIDAREIHRKLRIGEWTRLRRGVYVETTLVPDTDAGRHLLHLRSVLLHLQPAAAASHVTSAALHDLALLSPDFSHVHLTRDGNSARAEAGVWHHDAELPPGHLTKIDGLLTTSAARTVVDFARVVSFDAALVAAESALNRGLTTRSELREVLEYCRDWPGARAAGRVVSFASPYSESAGETLGRIAFDFLGLPQPKQQVSFFDDRGFIGRGDYYWEDEHTVGELDGRMKYVGQDADESVLYAEKLREDRLRNGGLEVVRFRFGESLRRSPSIRTKTLEAFQRAGRSTAPRRYRFELPGDRE